MPKSKSTDCGATSQTMRSSYWSPTWLPELPVRSRRPDAVQASRSSASITMRQPTVNCRCLRGCSKSRTSGEFRLARATAP